MGCHPSSGSIETATPDQKASETVAQHDQQTLSARRSSTSPSPTQARATFRLRPIFGSSFLHKGTRHHATAAHNVPVSSGDESSENLLDLLDAERGLGCGGHDAAEPPSPRWWERYYGSLHNDPHALPEQIVPAPTTEQTQGPSEMRHVVETPTPQPNAVGDIHTWMMESELHCDRE